MPNAQTPIADDLFTWPSKEPQLIASRCASCDVVTFPAQGSCPRCTSQDVAKVLLPRRGTLWTFTTQEFLPKNPPYAGTETADEFEPFAVGYVELPDYVMVETRLTEPDPAKLRIGMEMELVITPLRVNPAGEHVVSFAFAPVEG